MAYGNRNPDVASDELIEEIKRIDPDIFVTQFDPFSQPNYQLGENGEFRDVTINYQHWQWSQHWHWQRTPHQKKLFVLCHYDGMHHTVIRKVYALLDPDHEIVYKLDIQEDAIKVLRADLTTTSESNSVYPNYYEYVEVGNLVAPPLHHQTITAADVVRSRAPIHTVDITAPSSFQSWRGGIFSTATSTAATRPSSICNVMRRRHRTLQSSQQSQQSVVPRRLLCAATTNTNQQAGLLDDFVRRRNKKNFVNIKMLLQRKSKLWETYSNHVVNKATTSRCLSKIVLPQRGGFDHHQHFLACC